MEGLIHLNPFQNSIVIGALTVANWDIFQLSSHKEVLSMLSKLKLGAFGRTKFESHGLHIYMLMTLILNKT